MSEIHAEILGRIEGKVDTLGDDVKALTTVVIGGIDGEVGIAEKTRKHEHAIGNIKQVVDNSTKVFVTKEEFHPVRVVVYGAMGAILLAFVGALITLVIKSGAT